MNRREFLGACAVVAIATACKSNESGTGDVHVSATDLVASDADGVRFRARPGEDLVARLDGRGAEVWTRSESGTAPGQFDYPTSLVADEHGRLLVVDRGNARVQILDAGTGASLGTFGGPGSGTGEFHIARDIAATRDRIYVVDQCNHRVNAYDVAGRPFGTVGAFGTDAAGLNAPLSVAVDSEGTIYAVDSSADAVKRYHPDGRFAGVVEHPDVDHPQSVAVDDDGRLWIADGVAGRVAVLTPEGALVRSIPITLPDGRPGAPRDIAIAGRDVFVRALPERTGRLMDLTVGQLILFASDFVPAGTLACDGSTAPVAQWPDLAALLGTTFGGDGTTTFGLPNIPSTSMRWLIVTQGPAFGSGQFGMVGEVRPMVVPPPAGSSTATTWVPCDGRTLPIDSTQALFALLGTTFGGDGVTTFAMPNLPPVGGSITWWIARYGQFPGLDCDAVTPTFPSADSLACYLASISYLAYDASSIGRVCGYALCRGQTLRISQFVPLFSLIGTTFGGNGSSNFVLPNLPVLGKVTPAIVVNGVYPSRS